MRQSFLGGRSGEFDLEIWIKITGEKSFWYLPIKGFIDDTLSVLSHTAGQKIRCTADPNSRIAETTLVTNVRKRDNVEFDLSRFPEGVTIQEASRTPAQDGLILNWSLRIRVPAGLDSYHFDLVLQQKSEKMLPLIVLVQCYVGE